MLDKRHMRVHNEVMQITAAMTSDEFEAYIESRDAAIKALIA